MISFDVMVDKLGFMVECEDSPVVIDDLMEEINSSVDSDELDAVIEEVIALSWLSVDSIVRVVDVEVKGPVEEKADSEADDGIVIADSVLVK